MPDYIYWTTEQKGKWQITRDTPEEREAAIRKGAMFFSSMSLSKPYGNSGAPEPNRKGGFKLDFDGPNAVQDARDLAMVHLPDLYGANPYGLRFFMSGQKGVHIEAPAEYFGATDGDPLLPKIHKRIAAELKTAFDLPTLDMGIYNMKKGRMWRIPNVKRGNGRYKVPLTLEEFRDLPEADLIELTRVPREIDIIDDDPPDVCSDLKDLFGEAKAFVYQEQAEKVESNPLTDEEKARLSKEIPPCVRFVLTECPSTEKTNFNKLVLNLCKYFLTAGYDANQSIEAVSPFLEKYPHSETYSTREGRLQHWKEMFTYLSGDADSAFQCSYMKGLGLPGNTFECVNCLEGEKDQDEDFSDFPPLTPDQTAVNITEAPEPPDALLEYYDRPILIRKVVGAIMAAGGTGKTFFLQQLAYGLANGTGIGPLKIPDYKEFKVLMLCGEDPQDEVNRRLWVISPETGTFPQNLHVASVVGRLGPLMELSDGNPIRSKHWRWLRETIRLHMPLDVLIIDPKSRFYGLDENSNDHATRWITCLEALAEEFNLTILFSHHVSKTNAGTMDQNMSRGASAIVDGCRWVAGMTPLSENECKRYGIENPKGFVAVDIVKTNYAAGLQSKLIFRRTESGALEYAALESQRRSKLLSILYHEIEQEPMKYSKRDFAKNEKGVVSHIIETVKDQYPKFEKKEFPGLIEIMIDGYLLDENEVQKETSGPRKQGLKTVPLDPNNYNQIRF